jgi:hypothetical protein
MPDDELDYDLHPEDAEDLTATLRYILDGAIEVFSDIAKNPAPIPPAEFTPKEMSRIVRRMKEGTLDTGLPFEGQTELIGAFEQSLAQRRRIDDVLGALRQFDGMLRDCDEAHLEELRELEKVTTHLVKSSAREAGDAETVREVNRTRRKAGRSRRK